MSHESSRARTLLSLKSVATMATITSTDTSPRTGVREFMTLIGIFYKSSVASVNAKVFVAVSEK